MILASVYILHNISLLTKHKQEEWQAALFTSLLVLLEKTTRKMQICQVLVIICLFSYGEITAEEIALMSCCHFNNLKREIRHRYRRNLNKLKILQGIDILQKADPLILWFWWSALQLTGVITKINFTVLQHPKIWTNHLYQNSVLGLADYHKETFFWGW